MESGGTGDVFIILYITITVCFTAATDGYFHCPSICRLFSQLIDQMFGLKMVKNVDQRSPKLKMMSCFSKIQRYSV